MGEMSTVQRGCGRIEQVGEGNFDRHGVSGGVRGPRARGKVLQSGMHVAAVGDHAFILAAIHLGASCRSICNAY